MKKAQGDIKVTVTKTIHATTTPDQLAASLMAIVVDALDGIDDAGCDWLTQWETEVTDPRFGLYIDNSDWFVSDDSDLMTLVDAANLLKYGNPLTAGC